MSDTPRTDAKEKESKHCNSDAHAHYGWKFARKLENELTQAQQRITALEEALRFYADSKNYLRHASEPDYAHTSHYREILIDSGAKAREALDKE